MFVLKQGTIVGSESQGRPTNILVSLTSGKGTWKLSGRVLSSWLQWSWPRFLIQAFYSVREVVSLVTLVGFKWLQVTSPAGSIAFFN